MNKFIMEVGILLVICIETSILLYLFYKVSNKRDKRIEATTFRILDNLGNVISMVKSHSTSSDAKGDQISSQLSKATQNISTSISQLEKSIDSRLAITEDVVKLKLQSSSDALQNSIQKVHANLNKNLLTESVDIKREMVDIQKDMREHKDGILRTQTQSFGSLESKIYAIQREEHSYLQREFQSENNGISDLHAIIQEKFQSEGETLSGIDGSIQGLSNLLDQHIVSLKPLENLSVRLEILYGRLIALDEEILKQEGSLNGMVEKHVKLVEYTKELSETSKSIYDLMKLVLIKSITQQIPSPQN